MAKKSVEEQQELVKAVESWTVQDIKDAIIKTCKRQATAEQELADYKESYGAVIKEEKEMRATYLAALSQREEQVRLAEVKAGWAGKDQEKLRAVEVENG